MATDIIVPSSEPARPISRKKYSGICVKVYFSHEAFLRIAELARESGKRRVGLSPYIQINHGFAHEKQANTDGIARFLKMAAEYWKSSEDKRNAELLALTIEVEKRGAKVEVPR